ncbi:hypothetical protein ElyMa_001579100 [Elysia marginata]|uniref:C2H2-type domain-containing protein n=1 Tax=Elysia marginata TaxID=1093978 RepID=A0AAV4JES2_9GAST|nr:hypothetical protein ElyMa_001579100 [Elysia marginata]
MMSEHESDSDQSLSNPSADSDCESEYVPETSDSDKEELPSSDKHENTEPGFLNEDVPMTVAVTVTVQKMSDKDNNKISKDQCCFFCHKYVKKMGRHLTTVHKNEPEVAQIMQLPPGDAKRKEQLDKFRNLGNFKNNSQAISDQKGKMIPSRRPGKNIPSDDYIACPSCFGLFKKHSLWRHTKKCGLRSPGTRKPETQVQAKASTFKLNFNMCASDELKKCILSSMLMDDIGEVVRNDSLIMMFGSWLLHKYQAEKHLNLYVSSKMREVGRLLLELQSRTLKRDLKYFLKPSFFHLLLECVLNITKSQREDKAVPPLALKLGHSLKKCAQIQKSQFCLSEDYVAAKQCDTVVGLLNAEWAKLVSRHVLQQLKRRKRKHRALVPQAEYVKRLDSQKGSEGNSLPQEKPCDSQLDSQTGSEGKSLSQEKPCDSHEHEIDPDQSISNPFADLDCEVECVPNTSDLDKGELLRSDKDPPDKRENTEPNSLNEDIPMPVAVAVTVQNMSDKDNNKISKDQCCFFCHKYVKKMGRHLTTVHRNEPEVAQIAHLSPGDPRRKEQLDKFRNLGNFKNNSQAVSGQKGKVIPWRRPGKEVSSYDYIACPSCFGLFKKHNLWRHTKKCGQRSAGICTPQMQVQAQASTLMTLNL